MEQRKIKEISEATKNLSDKSILHFEDIINKVTDGAKVAQDKLEKGSKDWISYIKKHPVKASLITGAVCYFLGRIMKK